MQVICDVETNATIVGKEKKIDFQQCGDNACDEHDILYEDATMSQLVALINVSSTCSQTIQFDCLLSPIQVSKRFRVS